MDSHLSISYDIEGDILQMQVIAPYLGQETDMTDEGLVVRTNPKTGAVEAIEILGFARRFAKLGDRLEFPFSAAFSGVDEAWAREFALPKAAND